MHCDCPTRSSNSLGGSRSINDEGLNGSGLSDPDSALPGADHWNDDPKPFVWKATAPDIIAKVQRGRAALNRQINSTTDH